MGAYITLTIKEVSNCIYSIILIMLNLLHLKILDNKVSKCDIMYTFLIHENNT